jgi:anti-sigma factor RsiW
MKSPMDWNELLVRYHSGELDDTTAEQVRQELQRSPGLQQQLAHLIAIDRFLQQQSKLAQPSKNFTDKVMHGISLPVSSRVLSPKMGMLLLTGIFTMVIVALYILRSGWYDSVDFSLNVNVQSLYFEKLTSPNFQFPAKWVVTTFLILNLLVGFVLLDRTILKPYFQRRAEAFSV